VSDFYREAVFTVTTHGDEELAPLQDLLPQIVVGPDGCALDAEGFGCYACALGGADGRTLLVCAAPDFLEGNRRQAREAVVLSTTVDVGHAGLP